MTIFPRRIFAICCISAVVAVLVLESFYQSPVSNTSFGKSKNAFPKRIALNQSHANTSAHTPSNVTNVTVKEVEKTTTEKEKTLSKLAQLREIVQKQIHKLQNPEKCSEARQLLCTLGAGGGNACQLHHLGICLFLAIGTNRTLRFRVTTPEYSKELHDATYLPISDSCPEITNDEIQSSPHIEGNGTHETTHEIRVVRLDIRGAFDPFTSYAPYTMPTELKNVVQEVHRFPHYWWIGQVLSYIMRLKPELVEEIARLKKSIDFTKPVVGVHVRRGDKLNEEAKSFGLEQYMAHVITWFDRYSEMHSEVPRRVFLATDSPKVLEEAKSKYPDYKFLTVAEHTQAATVKGNRVRYNGFHGITIDMKLLADSNHLVCTFSSNVGRLVYTLSIAQRDYDDVTASSLDDGYMYYGQRPRNQEVTEDHDPPSGSDDIELRVGDLLYIDPTRRICDEKCFGTNSRTRKTGNYPMSKVREYAIPVEYLGFSGVI